MHAVAQMDRNLVAWLCRETNPDLNCKDGYGTTAAMYAASLDQLELLQQLVNFGSKLTVVDDNGQGCLFYAAFGRAFRVVEYLSFLEPSDPNYLSLDRCDSKNQNILHAVCANGQIDMVIFFVEEAEMNVDIQTPEGMTALMIAAQHGYIKIVQWLLEYGENNPESSCNIKTKNNQGYAAWKLAGMYGHYDTMKFLIVYGNEDISVQDREGQTLLTFAARAGDLKLVKHLVEDKSFNLDINGTTLNGRTGLMQAAAEGHVEVVEYFVQQEDTKLDLEDFDSRSAETLAINIYML